MRDCPVGSALVNTSFLTTVGALSALRLAWLLPVADEVVTGRRNLLMVLTVASAICATVALLVAAGLNGGTYPPPDRHRVEEV